MLSEEKNRILTQVGPGTPMGELLRRYWHPIGGASEFDKQSTKPFRLLGEDLVIYKDLAGKYGLVDRQCAHRRADLSYGFVEQTGIRCNYHGWLYDHTGRCIEQPFEDTVNPSNSQKERIQLKAYPVRELAGLLWAYMGPAPAPELPVYDAFTWENGFREIVLADIPCNWMQCQENSCDPIHFEWMHDNWSTRLKGKTAPYAPRHLKVKFEEFDQGFIYKRIREGGSDDNPYWTVGRVALWPNGFYLGPHFEWRVPVDDENSLSIAWFYMRVPKGREPYVQGSVPTWVSPIKDENGRWISSHVMNQDIVAWVGQGRIADRTKEHLGASDQGIAMIRKRFFDDIEAMKRGEDPKGVIRDPELARHLELPFEPKRPLTEGIKIEDYKNHPTIHARLGGFRHMVGQPREVRQAFVAAMGIAEDSQ
jgi:5,5'-dehydrodivanillate O-demethylase oxygenase subunit